jgi:hypothetical protein
MCARHCAQRTVIFQICEEDEFRDIDLIGASRFRIGDVGKPFDFQGYIGERLVLFVSVRRVPLDAR